MKIYECILELMEDLLFVSTEIGNEYHAYGLIGNTALPYALNLIPVHYKSFKKPMHQNHFMKLNKQGVFLTPATFIDDVVFKMERFNCMPDSYYLTWTDKAGKGGRRDNYPDEGWWKMIARGNKAVFYTLSESKLDFPTYIRLGKFMSKCRVSVNEKKFYKKDDGIISTDILLRAEDIPSSVSLVQFEKIPIQHGIYLRNLQFKGEAYIINSDVFNNISIPVNSSFYCNGGNN